MTNQEIQAKLMAVKSELEKLEVRGIQNMKIVLACTAYLEGMATAIGNTDTDEE